MVYVCWLFQYYIHSDEDRNQYTNKPTMEFEYVPGKMKEACNNNFTVLEKANLEIFEDDRLFTENNGLVEIYDQGFCVDMIRNGSSSSISALKCQNVNPRFAKNCTKRNNMKTGYLQSNSSCSRYELDSTFRIVYSVLGGFSLVSLNMLPRCQNSFLVL